MPRCAPLRPTEPDSFGGETEAASGAIERGTRQLVTINEVARRLGRTPKTVRHWWWKNRLIGQLSQGESRKRVVVPVEVVEFYLRHHRLPTKLELVEAGELSPAYLLELSGPDGGLREFVAAHVSEGGELSLAAAS